MADIYEFPERPKGIEIPQVKNPTDEDVVTIFALMSVHGYFDLGTEATDEQRINYMKSQGVEGPPWPWQAEFEKIRTEETIQNSRILRSARKIVQWAKGNQ